MKSLSTIMTLLLNLIIVLSFSMMIPTVSSFQVTTPNSRIHTTTVMKRSATTPPSTTSMSMMLPTTSSSSIESFVTSSASSSSSMTVSVSTVDPTTILTDVFGGVMGTPIILAIPIVVALGVVSLIAFFIISYANPAADDE